MMHAWERPSTGAAAAQAGAMSDLVPVLGTERLVLRAPLIGDFQPYAGIFMSGRAAGLGGPLDREGAWNDFCEAVAGWMLRGMGLWTIIEREGGVVLGFGYLWQEYGDPEPEIGWVLTEAAEGKGYAREAAEAIRAHAFDTLGMATVVSYVDHDNGRSIALAERLGAVRDPGAEAAMADPVRVYRHRPEGRA